MLTWLLIAGMALATVGAYSALGLKIDPWSGPPLLVVPACGALAWFYRFLRPDPWISHGAEITAQTICILILGLLLSYAAAAGGAGIPYRNGTLAAADRRRLGFDWRAYRALVVARPWLETCYDLAYAALHPQFVLVIGILVATRGLARLQVYTLATGLCVATTIALFVAMPARGYYAYLGVAPYSLY